MPSFDLMLLALALSRLRFANSRVWILAMYSNQIRFIMAPFSIVKYLNKGSLTPLRDLFLLRMLRAMKDLNPRPSVCKMDALRAVECRHVLSSTVNLPP